MASNNLGQFAVLPPELRHQIWAELRPQNDSTKTDLHILRTCKQLSEEISPFIYDKEVLTFKISPVYRRRAWMSVTNTLGATWHLESSSHATSLGFADLLYRKLEGIKIEIPAPDPADPGQILNIRTKVCGLVDLLRSKGGELPNIDIYLIDIGFISWIAQDGKPQLTIKNEGVLDWMAPQDFDYVMTLFPFCQLRNCRSVRINAPPDIDVSHGEDDNRTPLEFFAFLMCLKISFGEFLDEGQDRARSDAETKEWLDEAFVDLDCALDHLPGKTARWLRLERYAAWFDDGDFEGTSKYVDEWERIMKVEEWVGYFSKEIKHFRWRWRCMVAFNPCSATMRNFRKYDNSPPEGIKINDLLERWSGEDRPCFPSFYEGSFGFKRWTAKLWENYYYAEDDFEKYKRLDKEDREKEDADNRKYDLEEYFECKEEPGSKDGWDNEEWFRFYPDGIPPLDESLFFFEAEMGHLWSVTSQSEPRHRFQKWKDAVFDWEHEWRWRMYIRATRPKIRVNSDCSCCFEDQFEWPA